MKDPVDRLNDYIEALRADRHPQPEAWEPGEGEMLRTAALLKAARAGASDPDPAFLAALQERLAQEGRGTSEQPQSLSRRRLLAATAASLAAGAIGGLGIGKWFTRTPPQPSPRPDPPLVREDGRWVTVANLSEVPPGTVLRFTAGAIEGHLINRGGELYALSAICTHMGCTLGWEAQTQRFECPCHGANFNTQGESIFTPSGAELKPLPPLQVKVEGDQVSVWAI